MTPLLAEEIPLATSLLMALGVGGILTKLAESVIDHLRGKHDREHTRVQAIIVARDRAEDERDEADRCRRLLAEHAHRLRLRLIELGDNPEPLPTCHSLPKEPPDA